MTRFTWLDALVLVAYLGGTTALGLYVGRKQRDAKDYFVADGAIAPGGKLAVNTSGGGLSYCHPGMYGLLVMIEAIRQVRGECGQRQVKNCDVALAQGNGGVFSSECTVIFGSETTL